MDVSIRHAIGQTVRTARVVGDVAADRTRLLTARIGREVHPEMGDLSGQVEVQDPRFDPGESIHRIDREHSVHLRRRDDDRAARSGPLRRRGPVPDPRATNGTGVFVGDSDDRLHVGRRFGEAHDRGLALDVRGVTTVQVDLGHRVAHLVGAQLRSEPGDEIHHWTPSFIADGSTAASTVIVVSCVPCWRITITLSALDGNTVDEDLITRSDVLVERHETSLAAGVEFVLGVTHHLSTFPDGVGDIDGTCSAP